MAQFRAANAAHMNKKVEVGPAASNMFGITGHNWKHLTLPPDEYESPAAVNLELVEDGMFTPCNHHIDNEVNANDVLDGLPARRAKGIQPAGPASIHRMTAATCFTVEDAANEFSNAGHAWRCCLMGKGLLFQRINTSLTYCSLGAQTWAWAGVKLMEVQVGSKTYYVPPRAESDATNHVAQSPQGHHTGASPHPSTSAKRGGPRTSTDPTDALSSAVRRPWTHHIHAKEAIGADVPSRETMKAAYDKTEERILKEIAKAKADRGEY